MTKEEIIQELTPLLKTKAENFYRMKEEMPFVESTYRFWKREYDFLNEIESMPDDELKTQLEISLVNIISLWYMGEGFEEKICELYKKLGVIYFGEEFVDEMDKEIGEDV